MSIASEITRLQGVKSDIITAIANKGVVVPAGSALDDCPSLIGDIGKIDSVTIGGDVYPVVFINGQYWMAKNVKYHTSYYKYPNDNSANEDSCGLLYGYSIAQNEILPLIPKGWRLPTRLDFQRLFTYDSNPLNYISEVDGGNNSNGMNVRLAGLVTTGSPTPSQFGIGTWFWTSTYSDINKLGYDYFIRNYSPKITDNILDVENKTTIESTINTYGMISLRFVCDKLV